MVKGQKLAIEQVIADYGYGALTFEEIKDLRSFDEVEKAGIWHIVGKGDAYTQCGKFVWQGCFNNHIHKNGKNFRKGKAMSCCRAECPVCFLNWVTKQAHIIVDRLIDSRHVTKNYRGRVIHLVLSISPEDENSLTEFKFKNSYHKLRTRVYENLKRVGAGGGTLVPHPFRHDYDAERDYEMDINDISIYKGDWHYSPHFHYMGFGWIRFDCKHPRHRGLKCKFYKNGKVRKALCVRHNFEKFGYVVNLIRIVEDYNLLTCAKYVLNHAGVQTDKKGKSYNTTISWFGTLSYNKLVLKKGIERHDLCPDCNEILHFIKWDNSDKEPPPEDELEHWDEPNSDDWIICDDSMPENRPYQSVQMKLEDML